MPAPQRKPKQMVSIANDAIFPKEEDEIPFKPVIVRAPGHTNGDSLERFTEIIMFGVAMVGIWIGLFLIAYGGDVGEERYMVLFAGGLISAVIALSMVEFQAKKNEYHLMISQNYLLGLSFFFMAVGTLWGIRYLGGFFTVNELIFEGTLSMGVIDEEGIYNPGPNMIYAQALGAVAMWFAHQRILDRYKGDTSFGWAVATYIPLALLLVGVGRWIVYADYEVSYPLGISIVGLCGLAMYSALMSNKAINFAVVSVVSSIIPIIYEVLNDNADIDGRGGALSLLIFILIIQGYMAGNERLKQSLAEKMSFFVIGVVVIAMLYASTDDLNLVLGPLKSSNLSDLGEFVTLPVALWITVLCAYFPATLRNRVPAMPIGLAFSLWTLNGDEAIVPWTLALIMISYMLFYAKATRMWVANLTLSALSLSYLLSDSIGYGVKQVEINIAIAIGIVIVAETARRLEKVSIWSSVQTVTFIALSSTILDSNYWFVTWIFVVYLLGMVYESMLKARNGDDLEKRNATLALLTSLIISSGLLLGGKLEISDSYAIPALSGMSLEYLVLGLIVYALFNTVRDVEVDIGSLLRLLELRAAGAYAYDSETNAWYIKEPEETEILDEASFGSIGRISLAFSLLAITIGISTINADVISGDGFYFVGLYILPVSILFWEINSMDKISSQSRMIGAFMLLIIALSAMPLMLDAAQQDKDGLFQAGILFDILFLSLVAAQYRHHGVTMLAPLATISLLWLGENGIAYSFLESNVFSSDPTQINEIRPPLWFTPVTGTLVAAHMLMPIAWSIREVQLKEDQENPFPYFLPMVWFVLAIWAVLPTASWLPLIACMFGLLNAWVRGDINLIPMLSVGLMFSFMIGFADTMFVNEDDAAGLIFGYSMLFSGIAIYLLWVANKNGILQMNVIDEERLEKIMPYTLDTQLRFLAIASLLLSFYVVNGMGMLVGSAWVTYEAIQKGDKVSILFLPLVDGLAAMNLIHSFGVGPQAMQNFLAGGIFFLEGAAMIYLSSKTDAVYDSKVFEWKDDDEFFQYIEYMGFSGVVAALGGVMLAFGANDQTELALFLTATILTALAITGFDKTQAEVRWRRGLGVFGSVLTLFILFMYNLENDGEILFRGLTLVSIGMLALGYGFLYMNRRSSYNIHDVEIPQVFDTAVPKLKPTPVQDQEDEQEDEDEEDLELEEALEDELEELDELDALDEVDALVEMASEIEDKQSNIGYIKTSEGFDVRLPKESIETISRTIEMTPHEGFKPVVRVNMLGQIVLDFEPL